MSEFRMPALGADMESGTVVEWLVAPGDQVHRGDVVAVVDTDKSVIDVECFADGVVNSLLVQPGQRVDVGTPLALIGAEEPVPEPIAAPAVVPGPVRSPLARKRAAEAGIDLAAITGTGPGGTITRGDVDRAIKQSTPCAKRGGPEHRAARGSRRRAAAPPAPTRLRLSPYARRLAAERGIDESTLTGSGQDGIVHARDVPPAPPPRRAAVAGEPLRRATAALMARANREIPHYYLALDIELGPALEWLRGHNRAIPVADRVLPAAMLLRAVVLAARAVPQLNGHWIDDRFVPGDGVHIGVAVSLREGGLVVPVIRDADRLGLDELMTRTRASADRARSGHLRSSEASGATITVTNLGELGVDQVHGVIHPPQVALVGFGAVGRRPWADGDAVAVRPVVTATLAGDHRVTDGAVGARLLHQIDRHLHRPEEL
jgi:pyruvate dehydrogenase E2 component (dihydrolipoamide acetyltransferase)